MSNEDSATQGEPLPLRINVGCGSSPTPGWRNFDNSPSLRLARVPLLPGLLEKAGIITAEQHAYALFARASHIEIEYCNATRRIPLADGSVDVLYSSHMLEHLQRQGAATFLREGYRVLRPGGILRLVIPDLRKQLETYGSSGDADEFMESTMLCDAPPAGFIRRVIALVVGARNHRWMYDGRSLCRLVTSAGFVNARAVRPGETRIQNPDGLDLAERASESAYVEAEKPLA